MEKLFSKIITKKKIVFTLCKSKQNQGIKSKQNKLAYKKLENVSVTKFK